MSRLEALKEELRQRVNLVDVVSEHVNLKRAGKDFSGLCPFHNEKTPSFTVSPSKGIFKCFGCNAGGDVFTFVQLREGVDFMEAIRILAERAGLNIDEYRGGGNRVATGPDRADLARVNAWAADMFIRAMHDPELGGVARDYIAERQISPEIVERFGLGFAPEPGGWILNEARRANIDVGALEAAGLTRRGERGDLYGVFRARLMFPIRDTMNRVLGFGGRTLRGDKAKYLNTTQTTLFDKGRNVYGLDAARNAISQKKRAIVVEGYTDCLASHQFGFDEAVATLGTALTSDQVSLLRRWCDEVILLMDSDEAGQNAADRALEVVLRQNVQVRIAHVPDGKDPFDFLMRHGADAFEQVLNSASDALGFKWGKMRRLYGADGSPAGRRQAVEEFIGLVAGLARFRTVDVIQQGLIVNDVAALLGMPSEEVFKLLRQAASRASGVDDSRPRPMDGVIPSDAEQTALTVLLEVLLNQPDLYPRVEGVMRAERFADVSMRRLVGRVLDLCASGAPSRLIDFLNGVEDPQDARLLTDLYYRGYQRGNIEATAEGALRRLEEIDRVRDARTEVRRLREASDDADLNERLTRVHQCLAASSGFAPKSIANQPSGLPDRPAADAPFGVE